MRLFVLAGAVLAVAFAATLSVAQADSNYGPRRVGNQCWHNQGWNSIGYWAPCEAGGTAQAKVVRTSGKKK